ncbi:MAG: histidine--tRNA ligase [Elusimicrobia bacterium]|nr:histidine--tRNA ligase [Elusimicrobiota bacterium]
MGLSTSPPSGFRDFLPEACAARHQVVETISRVYRAFGFLPIATSAVEDLEMLMGKGGGDNEKLIFKILKRGEKLESAQGGDLADMGLRFDLTLPLARYYSRFSGQLPHPFKAFHIGPVWRAERAQKGRYREFFQCDADIIGSESLVCEIEVISAILAALKAFDLEPVVALNDRGLALGQLRRLSIPEDKLGAACVILDKIDKAGEEAVRADLAAQGLERAWELTGLSLADFAPVDRKAVDTLKAIIDSVNESSGRQAVEFSSSLMRGFDYYTGPVFEFRHPRLSGSLGGGGRYDRLTEKFSGKPVPACGGSIGFERLMLLLDESDAGAKVEGPDACVLVFSEELLGVSLRAAALLRRAGWSVDVYPGSGKLKAQFKYADSRKAKLAVIIGPEEAALGQVKVKELSSGTERLTTLEALAAS